VKIKREMFRFVRTFENRKWKHQSYTSIPTKLSVAPIEVLWAELRLGDICWARDTEAGGEKFVTMNWEEANVTRRSEMEHMDRLIVKRTSILHE
jgi:hypothetical protein